MQLNDIEMSIAVGRTPKGQTITVRDILMVLAKVSGARLGSQQFDQILTDPLLLHAPDMLTNARRYAVLSSILDGTVASPERIKVEASRSDDDDSTVTIHFNSSTQSEYAEHLSTLLDGALSEKQSRG